MKTPKTANTVQIYTDTWYLDKFEMHECCDCGLVHDVKYKVENGRIFFQWNTNVKETEKVRKDLKIKVTRGKPSAK
jgi:hypothetical protein